MVTDASKSACGGYLEEVRGVRSQKETQQHINVLEMRAVFYALNHFQQLLVGQQVLVKCDNTTVVSYINKQ